VFITVGGCVAALVYIYKAFVARASRDVAIKTELINRIKDRMEGTESSSYFIPIDVLKEELLGANNFEGKFSAVNIYLLKVTKLICFCSDAKVVGFCCG
jgi:hypothetical protein